MSHMSRHVASLYVVMSRYYYRTSPIAMALACFVIDRILGGFESEPDPTRLFLLSNQDPPSFLIGAALSGTFRKFLSTH